MDPEMREILNALLEGQRAAAAERKADRAMFQEMIANLGQHTTVVAEHTAVPAEHSTAQRSVLRSANANGRAE